MIVPNLEKSLDWYVKNLGFEIKGRFKRDDFEIVYIDNGHISYEFFENASLKSPVIDHIAYISDDIQADHALCKAQGLEVTPISYIDFTWDNGTDYFFVQGPEGEKIEYVHVR